MLFFLSRAVITLFIFLIVSSAYAHNKVVVIPFGGDDAPPTTVYEIGDEGPGGGIVFHVTNEGINGLEAAPVDQSGRAPWGCIDTDLSGLDNVDFTGAPDSNSGGVNTLIIGINCGIESAAAVAALYTWPNGNRDGFLPNKEEINLLFVQQDVVGGFVFGSSGYWSSSEINKDNGWFQLFDIPAAGSSPKANNSRVRAIRAF